MHNEVLTFEVTVEDKETFKRLDAFLSAKLPELSRSLIKKQFENGKFKSNSKLELKKMPTAGTKIEYFITPPETISLEPENIPLDILFEDEHLIIINKAAGMVVHPAPGNYSGTLVNAILHHCPDLKGIGDEKRPGIVHRLDKGTTGVMMVAKDQQTHIGLVDLLSRHEIERRYETLLLGARIPPEATLDSPIGRSPNNRLKMSIKVKNAKEAITHFKALEFFKNIAHGQCTLETGRTHQIRVHLSMLLNSPILNDSLYGRAKEEAQMISSEVKGIIKDYAHPFLHAKVLGFTHPITKEQMRFEKEPPQLFQDVLEQLRKENAKINA